MNDCTLLLCLETTILFFFWPRLMKKRAGYHNRALLRDNPHLKKCYVVWRWAVPFIFVFFTFSIMIFFNTEAIRDEDVWMLNLLVVFIGLVIGGIISEVVAEYFRRSSRDPIYHHSMKR